MFYAHFTVRVDLHGSPTYETFRYLHEAMERKGFSRKVLVGAATCYLPNSEYTFNGNCDTKDVLELAKKAAVSVWKDFGVVVTRTEAKREFYNLQTA